MANRPVPPADGENLTEGCQRQEEDGAKNRSGLLHPEEVQSGRIQVIGSCEASDGPENQAANGNQDSNPNPRELWKRFSDGA